MVDFHKLLEKHQEQVAARRADPKPLLVVVNCHHPPAHWPIKSWRYIGRRMGGNILYTGSPLGNPYPLASHATDTERAECLMMYKQWLWAAMKDHDSPQYRELLSILEASLFLEGLALGCWCAPKSCHGDVIKAAVEWMWRSGVRPEGWTPESIR